MEKDFFHESVLQFRDWAEAQPGLGGYTWNQLFDMERVEEFYLEKWNYDQDDSWFAEEKQRVLNKIREEQDPLDVIPLYRVIFHETGLIDPESSESIEEEKENDRNEKENLTRMLDRLTLNGNRQLFLDVLQQEWKNFHKVVDYSLISQIKETSEGVELSTTTRYQFDDGKIWDRSRNIQQFFNCPHTTEIWKNVLGDSLQSVWRGRKDMHQGNVLEIDDGVLLKMTNGKTMLLSASEWGAIEPIVELGPQDKPIMEEQVEGGYKI